jgi:hypothetical protein
MDGSRSPSWTRRAGFFPLRRAHPLFAIEKSALGKPGQVEALRGFLRERKPGNYLAG